MLCSKYVHQRYWFFGNLTQLLFCSLLLTSAAHALSEQADKALLLHSQGLGQELDGQHQVALALLRQAIALAPQDRLIAFDLARLAWEQQSPQLAQDSAPFLALEPIDDAEKLLHAYIQAALGQRQDSQVMLQKITQNNPDIAREALLLQQSMERSLPNSPAENQSPNPPQHFRPWIRANVEIDTNVTVLPDSVSLTETDNNKRKLAFRLNGDAGLMWRPILGQHGLQLDVQLRSGTHLTNRAVLADYDTELVAVQASFHSNQGPILLAGGLLVNQLYTNSFRNRFLGQLGGQASAMFNAQTWRLGPYIQAAVRDFDYQNKANTAFDRDGWAGETGLGFNWQERWFSSMVRLGYQTEMGRGKDLRQAGTSLSAMFHVEWQALRIGAHLLLQDRIFWQEPNQRRDNRLIPSVRLGARLFDSPVLATLAYSYTGNFSNNNNFSYNRQIASCGLEAPW